jgi:anti-sigma-K factor RskA
MNPDEEERLDLDAAEYVLGTLRGERAEAFERRMREDAALARRVHSWQARLAPPVAAYPHAHAPEALWAGIARRTHGTSSASGGLAFWRRLAAACAAVAVIGAASLAWFGTGLAPPQCYAVLVDAQARPIAVVFDRRDMRELVVLPVGTSLVGAKGEARLWIIAGGVASDLGTLAIDGETRLTLGKPGLTAIMAPAARLVIAATDPSSATAAPLGGGVVALLGAAPPPKGT